jgi:hypothetical protein
VKWFVRWTDLDDGERRLSCIRQSRWPDSRISSFDSFVLLFCKQVYPIIISQNQKSKSKIKIENQLIVQIAASRTLFSPASNTVHRGELPLLTCHTTQYCIHHHGQLPLLTCHTAQYFTHRPSILIARLVLLSGHRNRIIWRMKAASQPPPLLVIFLLSIPSGLPCAHAAQEMRDGARREGPTYCTSRWLDKGIPHSRS